MSVIGFDIGNESCVIAVAKHGGIDVILNHESKRETPAVVSFGDNQRFTGATAAAFATSNPKSTVANIKHLIGKQYKQVTQHLNSLPFTTTEGPRGSILIELNYLKTKWTFTPVEILAMVFKHLKLITEKSLEADVNDCVIGIPAYFTNTQRREYLDAACIAGLNPLKLLHDGTAIALGYGMYITDFGSRPTVVTFVDIGHCDTQVTVAAFQEGNMKVLANSFDPDLGGRDFDEVLFRHFVKEFDEKYKIDVCSNTRACVRLRASCEKVKRVLSANSEAVISIECLIGDTDVRGVITRDEFENLSSKLLDRVTIPCFMALKDCGLSVDMVDTVELVGSGSRIPAITRVLASVFQKEPSRTLNASECVARGCALMCAMMSPSLQVREYKVEDSFPYSIVLPLPNCDDVVLFPKGIPFPNEKIVTKTGSNISYFDVKYSNETEFSAGISPVVGSFGFGRSEPAGAEDVEVECTLMLNSHGIVQIRRVKMMANSRSLNLPFSDNLYVTTTRDELCEARKKEKILAEQDLKVEQIKDQRNTLESFVYDSRSKLSGAYKTFATDSEKEVIINSLKETEDWLYEDSDDGSEQDYTGKLKDLKKLLESVEYKYQENIRAKAEKALRDCIAKYRLLADSLPASNKEMVKHECTRAERWLNNLNLDQHLSPTSLSDHYNHAIKLFESICKDKMKSKPSVPRHDEPVDSNQLVDSDQRGRPVDSDQSDQRVDSDQNDQPVDSDQNDQPVDSDQSDQTVDSDQNDEPVDSDGNEQPLDSNQIVSNTMPSKSEAKSS
ncbi:heat shock 70 kDa protein 16-like [Bidens hawaiensis]|uniref:heat shock 70 kDa protein 16-like n=1 Tax=Bidens hawaiensis TaxID=980011 RepID=UPI00404994FE